SKRLPGLAAARPDDVGVFHDEATADVLVLPRAEILQRLLLQCQPDLRFLFSSALAIHRSSYVSQAFCQGSVALSASPVPRPRGSSEAQFRPPRFCPAGNRSRFESIAWPQFEATRM